MHYSIRDFMHNLAVTVVVSEIFYTQADLCIIILCIMRMSTVSWVRARPFRLRYESVPDTRGPCIAILLAGN